MFENWFGKQNPIASLRLRPNRQEFKNVKFLIFTSNGNVNTTRVLAITERLAFKAFVFMTKSETDFKITITVYTTVNVRFRVYRRVNNA